MVSQLFLEKMSSPGDVGNLTSTQNATMLILASNETTPAYLSTVILAMGLSASVSIFFFTVFKRCPQIREKARFILLVCIVASETFYFFTLSIISAFSVFSWHLTYLSCSFLRVLSSAAGSAELYSVAAMCLDRYMAVCYPLLYDTICSYHNILRVVVTIFLMPLLLPFIIFILQNSLLSRDKVLGLVDACSFDRLEVYPWMTTVRMVLFSGQFIACFLIISGSYVLVVKEGMRVGSISSVNLRARRTLTFHMIQLTLYVMPVVVYVIYYSLLREELANNNVLSQIYTFNTIVFTFGQVINPIVYGLRADEVKPFLPTWLRRSQRVSTLT
ncbi:odorant receptor 131-2-like [Ambystoma mexicanum]|uniref:odorant receptor 131-2-like n=1 Tax=Ambystoma mexicanum TaxID=8296 RepID=UPI0037E8F5DD